MARALALRPQTLTLIRSTSPSILTPSRTKSSRTGDKKMATVIEIDLGPSASGSESGGAADIGAVVNRLEDAIHNIYVEKSAPDWLPLVPGSSYWVPPRGKKTAGVAADFVRLIKTTLLEPLTEEEAMSLKTLRGWPSSAYYVEGNSAKRSKKASSQSDDEE